MSAPRSLAVPSPWGRPSPPSPCLDTHTHPGPRPAVCSTQGSQRAKLSDMGLSKQLVAEQSSFESHGAGALLHDKRREQQVTVRHEGQGGGHRNSAGVWPSRGR